MPPAVSPAFGSTTVGNEDRLSVTFDFQVFASDVTYTVQSSGSPGGPWDDLVVIDGPYDDLVGSQSLTGDGGLIDDPEVVNIVDNNYSARITVVDTEDMATSPMRFIRILVDGDPVSVP